MKRAVKDDDACEVPKAEGGNEKCKSSNTKKYFLNVIRSRVGFGATSRYLYGPLNSPVHCNDWLFFFLFLFLITN